MKVQSGGRGTPIVLLSLQNSAYMGMGGQRHALAALSPENSPGNQCVGPRAG